LGKTEKIKTREERPKERKKNSLLSTIWKNSWNKAPQEVKLKNSKHFPPRFGLETGKGETKKNGGGKVSSGGKGLRKKGDHEEWCLFQRVVGEGLIGTPKRDPTEPRGKNPVLSSRGGGISKV